MVSIPEQQQKLLEAVLHAVPFTGWTNTTLTEAAQQLSLSETEAWCLFPNGITDVLATMHQWADTAAIIALENAPVNPPRRVRDTIAFLVMARLHVLTPYKGAMRALSGYYALPMHFLDGQKALWQTSNAFWQAAGDTATDFNYYSKRTLLMGVYASTALYWLQDTSTEACETEAFLQRRLENIMMIPKATAPFKKCFNATGNGISSILGIIGGKNHA